MRLAARFMSALLVASLVLPSLLAAPVAACDGLTDHFRSWSRGGDTAGVATDVTITVEARDISLGRTRSRRSRGRSRHGDRWRGAR